MFITTSLAERFIASQPWFGSLPASAQERVLAGLHALHADKGHCILPAGQAVGGWYAVLSGLVMLHSPVSRGRQSAFLGVPAGEWFGEGSAMKTEPRRYHVTALRPTELLCLPQPLFTELRETHLPFSQYLADHLNLRLGQAMAIIEAGRVRSPEFRIALYLSRLFWRSTRRIHLTQEELGHLVGLSRQTVNRVLHRLAQQGVLSLDFGRIAVLDDDALDAYLASAANA